MKCYSRREAMMATAALVAAAAAPRVTAADGPFPSSPIEILVPWGPGGGASQFSEMLRTIANKNRMAPQPFSITHRPGASGLVGTALVADRRGSPYTIMPGGGALLPQVVMKDTPVNPLRDLTPLALSAVDSSVVFAAADSPFTSLKDVIAALKNKPKSVTMGGAGGGPASWDGMLELTVGAIAGVEFNQIPFSSGAEVQAAVLGKQVDVGTRQLSNAEALITARQVKVLAIFDAERNPKLPNVPTMRELGYDVVLNLSRGWFAPGNLKKEEIQWYGEFFKKVDENPEWGKYIAQSGVEKKFLGPAEWATYIAEGLKTIDALYRKTGLVK